MYSRIDAVIFTKVLSLFLYGGFVLLFLPSLRFSRIPVLC